MQIQIKPYSIILMKMMFKVTHKNLYLLVAICFTVIIPRMAITSKFSSVERYLKRIHHSNIHYAENDQSKELNLNEENSLPVLRNFDASKAQINNFGNAQAEQSNNQFKQELELKNQNFNLGLTNNISRQFKSDGEIKNQILDHHLNLAKQQFNNELENSKQEFFDQAIGKSNQQFNSEVTLKNQVFEDSKVKVNINGIDSGKKKEKFNFFNQNNVKLNILYDSSIPLNKPVIKRQLEKENEMSVNKLDRDPTKLNVTDFLSEHNIQSVSHIPDPPTILNNQVFEASTSIVKGNFPNHSEPLSTNTFTQDKTTLTEKIKEFNDHEKKEIQVTLDKANYKPINTSQHEFNQIKQNQQTFNMLDTKNISGSKVQNVFQNNTVKKSQIINFDEEMVPTDDIEDIIKNYNPRNQNSPCKNDCSFNGYCISGKCVCKPNFHGDSCEFEIESNLAYCQFDCLNGGVCVAKGICKCMKGYTGYDCSIKQNCFLNVKNETISTRFSKLRYKEFLSQKLEASTDLECSGNGECIEDKCSCYSNYTGLYCEESLKTCSNSCELNGACYDGQCLCKEGHFGTDCEKNVLKCNLAGGMFNEITLSCKCNKNYDGEFCQNMMCPEGCDVNGKCDKSNGQCHCNQGYSGIDCMMKACPNDCNNHGKCFEGTCLCDQLYEGKDCSHQKCENSCHDNGVCDTLTSTCKCDKGFTGRYCEEKACFNSCLNGGTCKNGVCECPSGFGGYDCGSSKII